MNLRVCLLFLVLGVLLVFVRGAPVDGEEKMMESESSVLVTHSLQGRADTRQTVDDALGIPIAALEAVQRLLNNLFSSRTTVDVKKY